MPLLHFTSLSFSPLIPQTQKHRSSHFSRASTMPSKFKKAIGAVKDHTSIGLAKVSYSTSFSTLEVAVLKATTHDDVPIDDKYVSEVMQIVASNKVHAAACARAIGKRIGRTRNWVVALKSLMLVLRIFQDGDPYFPREVLHAMKRGYKILNLASFRDDSNSSPWDFTSFVRTFALYLDERLECFLTGKLQRRYMHEGSRSIYQRSRSRGARTEPVRDMKPAMLLDKMSCWQRLLDRAIATRPTGAAKTNNLVLVSLYAVVQETFDLYKDISDGLALVLDNFFHLQYQNCVVAFQICLKAVKQFKELSGFYTQCRSLGVGRSSEYPSVQSISEELIETLQEFLKDQSSFPAKSTTRLLPAPATPPVKRSSRHNSGSGHTDFSPTTNETSQRHSEFGSQCTSLEELISATESWTGPAISIDLEAYSESQRDDGFGISDTGSSRSLPVSTSIADLISLEDWTEQDDNEGKDQPQNQHDQTPKISCQTSTSRNWELVLAETMQSAAAALSLPLSDNSGTTCDAFSEQLPNTDANHSTGTTIWEFDLFEAVSQQQPTQPPLSDNITNTFNAYAEQRPPAEESPSSPTNIPINGWELELFQPPQPQQPVSDNNTTFNTFLDKPQVAEDHPSNAMKAPTNGWELVMFEGPPPVPPPEHTPNDHYNPFLMNPLDLPDLSNQQSALSVPTFNATPTFSVQNPTQITFPVKLTNDPFACDTEFSGEKMFSNAADQQNLLLQQQFWLQNQNKIIAKHMT